MQPLESKHEIYRLIKAIDKASGREAWELQQELEALQKLNRERMKLWQDVNVAELR